MKKRSMTMTMTTTNKKSFANLCVFFLICLIAGVPVCAKSQALTLDDAKKMAVDNSFSLASKKSAVGAADSRKGVADSLLYPNLSAVTGSEQSMASSQNDSSTFSYLSAKWNLYRGGMDLSGAKLARIEQKKSSIDYDMEKLSIENSVEIIFYRILYLRDVLKIKQRFIELNSKQQVLARQLVARGGGSSSDVLQFDLRASALESELAQIQAEQETYKIKLKYLLGYQGGSIPIPAGDLPHQHLQGKPEDYLNATLSETPEIQLAKSDLDSATEDLSLARGRWLPQVDIEGRFGSLPLSQGGEAGKLGSSIALVANWELFSGFNTSYVIKEKAHEKSRADSAFQNSIRTVLVGVESAFNDLITTQKRADIEKNNVRSAQRYYDLVSSDFSRGYKNSSDFNQAAQDWYDAETQRKTLDFDFIEKKLAIELKLGKRLVVSSMRDVDESEKTSHENK